MTNEPMCKIKPQNETQLHSLCNIIAGLIAINPETRFNSMNVAQQLHECFQIEVNWHDCSTALDVMSRTGRVIVDYVDRAGMQVYGKVA